MGILWSCCNDHPTSITDQQSFVTTSARYKGKNGDKNVTPREACSSSCECPSDNFKSADSELLRHGCSIVKVLLCGNEHSNNSRKNNKQQLPAVFINQIVSAEGDADASVEIAI